MAPRGVVVSLSLALGFLIGTSFADDSFGRAILLGEEIGTMPVVLAPGGGARATDPRGAFYIEGNNFAVWDAIVALDIDLDSSTLAFLPLPTAADPENTILILRGDAELLIDPVQASATGLAMGLLAPDSSAMALALALEGSLTPALQLSSSGAFEVAFARFDGITALENLTIHTLAGAQRGRVEFTTQAGLLSIRTSD